MHTEICDLYYGSLHNDDNMKSFSLLGLAATLGLPECFEVLYKKALPAPLHDMRLFGAVEIFGTIIDVHYVVRQCPEEFPIFVAGDEDDPINARRTIAFVVQQEARRRWRLAKSVRLLCAWYGRALERVYAVGGSGFHAAQEEFAVCARQ